MQLFPSNLIIYQNNQAVQEKIDQIAKQLNNKLSENNPDIFIVNQDSGWTITLIRSLKKFLSKKPFNHQNKIVIIFNAHNLNIESQNALLKSLEEPGNNNFIILTTNKESALLSTIVSRCHLIRLKNQQKSKPEKTNSQLEITGDFAKDSIRLDSLYKSKEKILPFLKDQLDFYQQELIKKPNTQNSHLVKKILKAIKMTESRVDPRNALDFIFLA